MSEPRWDRVKQIFHEVRSEPRTERERLLGVLCGDDDDLRAQVVTLLAADDEAGDFLDLPSKGGIDAAALGAARVGASDPPEGPGTRIGPYKLLQQIGEGGFGVVYMAEQEEPIRRRVALKVIKPGMDTKQVIARFEAERQAVAMMDHPNIARVFDAGTTPAGRPYFVMELVQGIPITDYCDEHRLDTRSRLELFGKVCSAVNHAHRNGIIHRDLKPSNVMVTLHDGVPVPKVIDFGVAKAIHHRLTERTLFTEYNQFIGTPTYMSPEQAAYEGLDVDARSDVYSLGVLLYELLTGTTPFDSRAMRRAAYFEVLRILKEEEPPRPSTRIHTLGKSGETNAKVRGADPLALEKMLRGDLDWIVMKALEKDRGRRYASPVAMAEDIERYFGQQPILARPPSRAYRVRKLLRRRQGRFAAAAALVALLVADVAYVNVQRARMGPERGLAEAAAPARQLLASTRGEDWCPFYPTPSPDGSRIAYSDLCGTGGLWVLDAVSGERTRLSGDDEYYWGLAWSADGTTIMAGRQIESGNAVEVFDVASGAREVPAAFEDRTFLPLDLSADGRWLVGNEGGVNSATGQLAVSLPRGEEWVLDETPRQGQAWPRFSPDARFVAFSSAPEGDPDGVEDLYVLELASGERWPLVTAPGVEGTVLWAPHGDAVLYSNEEGTWVMPVAAGRPSGPARLVWADDRRPIAWTDEGLFTYVGNSLETGHRLAVDPATGSAAGEWESLRVTEGPMMGLWFSWSPDMRRTAAAGWSDGTLYVLDGATTRQIPVSDEMLPTNLWWSSDGSRVYLTSSNRAQRERVGATVTVVDPETGDVGELFPPMAGASHMHVSPDGTRMVSLRADGDTPRARLVISGVGEREGRTLAENDDDGRLTGRYGQPRFSPDGRRVAYLRQLSSDDPRNDGGNRASLWVVNTDGSEDRRLASKGWITRLRWDPTGRMIAYQEHVDSQTQRLWIVSVDDGREHEIESFAGMDWPGLLTWSPDGRWIAVADSEGWSELWLDRDFDERVTGVRSR